MQTPWIWCRSCKRNLPSDKNHIYHKTHKERLVDLLCKEYDRIKTCRFFLTHPGKRSNKESEDSFWCFCCEKDIKDSSDFISFAALKHLSSGKHKKELERFWTETGAYLIKNELGKKNKKGMFRVNEQQYKQFIRSIKSFEDLPDDQPPISAGMIEIVHTNDSHANTAGKNTTKELKTVVSPLGIIQNPTGFHEGQRVWGGGIVKVKNIEDWLPWPIDLLPDESIIQSSVHNNTTSNHNTNTSLTNGVDSNRFRTAVAFGENLTCINQPELDPGEGNIHSGATPPWLRALQGNSSSSGAMSSNTMFQARSVHGRRAKSKKPTKLGADLIRGKDGVIASKNFVPNFGGVWQEGPRSDSRKSFLEEKNETVSMQQQQQSISSDVKNMKDEEQHVIQIPIRKNMLLSKDKFDSLFK